MLRYTEKEAMLIRQGERLRHISENMIELTEKKSANIDAALNAYQDILGEVSEELSNPTRRGNNKGEKEMDIEKAINQEVRFQWEETASPWNGHSKMTPAETFDVIIEDIEATQEIINYVNKEVRRRFNEACDQYQSFLDGLGPKY